MSFSFNRRRTMKLDVTNKKLILIFLLFLLGFGANALSYDYSASIECLEKPLKPQYNGGIIQNPELNNGLQGWSAFGDARVEHRESNGNRFVIAHRGNKTFGGSVSQKLFLKSKTMYTFSAWIQVSGQRSTVSAIFKTARNANQNDGYNFAGAVVAQSNCWSMLKGGLTVDVSGPAHLYFESEDKSAEIWVDSISLQPFTPEEWKSHQDLSINKYRKTNVKIKAVDQQGNPLANAKIIIEQKKIGFPFGVAINKNILTNTAYQNWFAPRFTVTSFENEMKWYSTEPTQGGEDYSVPDAMLQFAKANGIAVRGHNVFWEDPQFQQAWVKSLDPNALRAAALKRLNSVMGRYKGQLIHWDVVNENLHFDFLESKLGGDASSSYYSLAQAADQGVLTFLNDYNTIEEPRDSAVTPAKYIAKLNSILQSSSVDKRRMGIGLESHFQTVNIPYMRSAIDTLGAAGVPIWLTEIDVQNSPAMQATFLEQILREAHAHPQVKGMIMWSAWSPSGCYRMCLTDNNFKNLATGDVVDKLLREWGGAFEASSSTGTTDSNGFFDAPLFHGDYEVKVLKHSNSSTSHTFTLDDVASQETTLLLHI